MEDTDIVSEPAYREEVVTDIDFSYPSRMCQFTLREGDTISEENVGGVNCYRVHQQARNGSPEEDIDLFLGHLEWKSVRKRVIKWPLKKPVITATDKAKPIDFGNLGNSTDGLDL